MATAEETGGGLEISWRSLVESLPDHVAVLRPGGEILFANRAFSALGLAQGGFLCDLFASEYRQSVREAIEVASGKEESATMEGPITRADGTHGWFAFRVLPIRCEGRVEFLLATGSDATAGRETEERLRLMALAVEQIREGIAVADLEGYLLFVNSAFAEMHGCKPEELVGKHLSIFHSPDQLAAVDAANRRLREAGEFVGEIWHTTRDGRPFLAAMRNTLLRDQSGQPIGMIGCSRDLTSRRQAEDAQRESERRLSTLMGNLPGMAYRCRNDEDWTMEFVSEGCLELTGYEAEDLIGNAHISYAEVIHPQDRATVWDMVQEGVERHELFQLIYRIQTRSGQRRWVWEQGRGVYDENGTLLALEGFITDVTDREQAEKALRESEERFRRLAGAAFEGIIIHDRGRILDVNEQAAILFGHEPSEMIGWDAFCLIAPESVELIKAKVASGTEEPYEAVLRRRDGSCFPAEIAGRPIPHKGGVARVTTIRDITERKRAEEEEAIRARAERLLLQELNHRVRNNLMTLDSLINLAGESTADIKQFARSMSARVQTMATVHSLLSTSRWQPLQLRALIEAMLVPAGYGRFRLEGPAVPVPASQAQALGMVINELMTNSLKYGALLAPEGFVTMTWSIRDAGGGEPRLSFSWLESGGPPIETDPVERVGSSLVRGLVKSELQGRAKLRYPRTGAEHEFEFVLHDDSAGRLEDAPSASAKHEPP